VPVPTSLSDVARTAGVSVSTASLALRTERRVAAATRVRVLDAARNLGYVPNELGRSMRSGRTRTVGIVIQQTSERIFSHPYFTEVIGGITETAVTVGYTILLSVSSHDESEDAYLRLLESGRADGAILLAVPLADRNARRIAASGLPVVFVGVWNHQPPIHSVGIDDRVAAMAMVEHLIDQGYDRIAHLTGKPGHASAMLREDGYRAALAAAGRAPDPALVAEGDFSTESGRTAMLGLLNQGHCPDAVFAASDEMAVGAFQALRERGLRVPAQIALAGFDDIPIAALMSPPLTTVHHPMREIGRAAGQLLFDQLAETAIEPVPTVFPTHLVVRASTVRPVHS
jgi:DNA-binding LacI/PurR family transcriptional regulator